MDVWDAPRLDVPGHIGYNRLPAASFRLDKATGRLQFVGFVQSAPTPVPPDERSEIEAGLPPGFYAGRPLAYRVKRLTEKFREVRERLHEAERIAEGAAPVKAEAQVQLYASQELVANLNASLAGAQTERTKSAERIAELEKALQEATKEALTLRSVRADRQGDPSDTLRERTEQRDEAIYYLRSIMKSGLHPYKPDSSYEGVRCLFCEVEAGNRHKDDCAWAGAHALAQKITPSFWEALLSSGVADITEGLRGAFADALEPRPTLPEAQPGQSPDEYAYDLLLSGYCTPEERTVAKALRELVRTVGQLQDSLPSGMELYGKVYGDVTSARHSLTTARERLWQRGVERLNTGIQRLHTQKEEAE